MFSSHIKMDGLSVFVDEVVVERHPPSRKVWCTTGATRLVVIGDSEMDFGLKSAGQEFDLRVWIDDHTSVGPGALAKKIGRPPLVRGPNGRRGTPFRAGQRGGANGAKLVATRPAPVQRRPWSHVRGLGLYWSRAAASSVEPA
jgi:hypothetical protein